MPSMQDQAMINLLGVKGGARKAFAENTSDIARSMTPAQYQKEMLKEINRVLPKLEKTVASFDLTRIERVVYQRMIDRLKAGKDVDWAKFQGVHSKVQAPLKLAEGIVSVPGPKGAGDIQPAMLSPGEAVIPAKQSAKYMPLIQSMIADRVPGFAESNIDFDGNGKLTHKPFGMSDSEWKTDPRNASRDLRTGTNTARTPDKVERAIDKIFDKPRVKKLADRFDGLSKKIKEATPRVADLGKTSGDAANSTIKNTQVGTAMTKEELKNARQLNQMNKMGRK